MTAERKLLARLTTPETLAEVWDAGVRREWFVESLYGAVFEFTINYWRESQLKAVPTPWALAQEFPGYTVIDDAEETTDYLVVLLQRRYVTNQLQEMLRSAGADQRVDPLGALKTLHAAAYAASETVAPRNLRSDMSNVAVRRERYERGPEYSQGMGATYGIDLLDLHTGGIRFGELAVVGAFSKTGKTMFLLNAAAQAVRRGYRPMIYSLELSLDETETRMDAMYSGVSYSRLDRKQLTAQEKDVLWTAQDDLAGKLSIERPEEGDRTVVSLCARARQVGADYLIIDQLPYLEPGQRVSSLKEHHAVIMRQLKNEISRAGRELPCLMAVQANRDSVTEGMSLKSFANATEVEQTVDMALGLWRNQDMRNNHAMRCDILGSRRTDIASWLLQWELANRTEIRAVEEIRG